jgi:hypothetical protein
LQYASAPVKPRRAHDGEMRSGNPVEVLQRWQDSGAVWRVVSRSGSAIVVALLTCSAGEEVDRITSTDPEVLAFVGRRVSSEEHPRAGG